MMVWKLQLLVQEWASVNKKHNTNGDPKMQQLRKDDTFLILPYSLDTNQVILFLILTNT